MEAIEAVVALVKERDELTETLDEYEDWFEELVGKTVSLAVRSKKKNKTTFRTCEVEDFDPDEAWVARDTETGELFTFDFSDIAAGDVWVVQEKN